MHPDQGRIALKGFHKSQMLHQCGAPAIWSNLSAQGLSLPGCII